jgi:hypothetical protein
MHDPTHQPSIEEDRQAGRVHYHQHSDHYFHHLLHQYQITMAFDAFLQKQQKEKARPARESFSLPALDTPAFVYQSTSGAF